MISNQDLPEYKRVVSLIPGGTLQFLDFGFNSDKITRCRTGFVEYEVPAPNGRTNVTLQCLNQLEDGSGYIDVQTGEVPINPVIGRVDNTIEPQYQISVEKALATYVNKWIPLPFFRSEGSVRADERRYRNGPTDWARGRIERLEHRDKAGNTHRLIVGFDTHTQADVDVTSASQDEGYASLAEMDTLDGAEFALVTNFKYYAWFLRLDWVQDWLLDLFEDSFPANRRGRAAEEGRVYEYLARYISLIDILHTAVPMPRIKLTVPRVHRNPIEVDLVVDIGNSRSIGMLIERRPGESLSLENGSVLEMRDLSRPAVQYKGTFSSAICFSRARFGDIQGYSRGSGRIRPSFSWPTVVRIGNEAQRLAVLSRREEGQTSMSSPKRYLWDTAPRIQEWRYAPREDDPSSPESPVNSGDFVGFINNEGTPLHAIDNGRTTRLEFIRGQANFPVTEPRFSRSSIMMFLISEIVAHALVQINSPTHRINRLNPDIPRRLRNVIFTTPSAMAVSERRLYEQWAKWAVEVLWKSLDWESASTDESDYRTAPQIKMDLDEATATQLVFVYNEIEKRFSGDARKYLELFGKQSNRYENERILRVASVDIGGGTTDMVINAYTVKKAGVTNTLVSTQEFREGFNVAGDDVIKSIIELHIIPSLASVRRNGIDTIDYDLLRRQIGRNAVDLSERERNLRAQLGQQVFTPIALHLIKRLEGLRMEELQLNSPFEIHVGAILEEYKGVDPDVLRFLKGAIGDETGQSAAINQWTLSLDLVAVAASITNVLTPYILDLGEIISASACDYLIISGRTSCLPMVRSIFFKHPPVLPSRIIPMSEYAVEQWYPFWTAKGNRIDDPKTTGVVGAFLYVISEGGLQNFHVRRQSSLRPASTIRYLGQMTADKQIRSDLLLFDGRDVSNIVEEELECSLTLQTRMFIGFRQLPLDRWKATPFYQLEFSNSKAAERASERGPYEVRLVYQRRFDDQETTFDRIENEGVLRLGDITDREGNSVNRADVTLTLKSLWADNHWYDTGLFEVA